MKGHEEFPSRKVLSGRKAGLFGNGNDSVEKVFDLEPDLGSGVAMELESDTGIHEEV